MIQLFSFKLKPAQVNCSRIFFKIGLLVLVGFFLPLVANAQYEQIHNAFLVSPAKYEFKLSAGENLIRNIYITNRFAYDADFTISVEDISGADVSNEVIKYYGEGIGPYSIRKFIFVENDHIKVAAGETKVVPMMISLPATIKPGGLYGSVFVTLANKNKVNGLNVSSRVGSLVFLRVKGQTKEQGEVKKFQLGSAQRILWSRKPMDFSLSFENRGNIYLNPYGVIEIKDRKGLVIDKLPIDPWFVFPDSLRTRLVTWDRLPLFGYYTATLILNHGYSEPHVTTEERQFLIVPLPLISGIILLIFLIWIFYQIIKRYKKWQI